ncbi:hypothetical protein EDEG_01811 [Edhazardia aedis USNM 41457]|uniref:60S ribosomal protein L20 n=1 Tax=Edhazardia aedis (strain USNM 41457) TaxID=1003232 RepID=J9D7X8_EDHAE|nr:hypothetical protein EDEG_01811 [Edhazardia aedis USNM 41457]|eukprot:EJW03901.1 hypothetical protein EDEG_01811 [Edhazardia aedis USNM 41457]
MIRSVTKEYVIHASAYPTEKVRHPQVFVMVVYAKNEIIARSKMNKIILKKFKIKNPLLLKIEEIQPNNSQLKINNYGITYVFRSRKGKHNMYKEFRALSKGEAVDMLVNDMASKHRAQKNCLDVIEVKEINNEEVKRMNVAQFAKDNVSFPIFRKQISIRQEFAPQNSEYFR